MKVNIIGQGMTNFGELWEFDLRQLAFQAALQAIKNAHLDMKDIDALYIANMNSSSFTGQEHLGALVASDLNLNCPSLRVEGACASGSLAIHCAFNAIKSGLYKTILVVGVEKMTDVDAATATNALAAAADEEWEGFYGVTFPSLYAMMAREHFRQYGTTREDLAMISVKNHYNATLNPNAHFHKEITVAEVLKAPAVASPLGLLDCSPISDGGAAIILSSEVSGKVELVTSEVSTDKIALHDRDSLTSIKATKLASKKAYSHAEITSKDINIAEVHDCFTIAELIAYEDLDFVKPGFSAKLIHNGYFSRKGKLPVNTSGGLKGCGHPVGATGVKQAMEISLQLAGLAGLRQITKPLKYGLTHNVGGSGATSVINIFKSN